jgi:HSP20 family protein
MSELILWKNQEMNKLRRDIERLFRRFRSDFGVSPFPEEGLQLELSETENSLTVKVEVPEISPEDVEISVTDDKLTIKGERRQETVNGSGPFTSIQRSYGSFVRSLPLPCKIKGDEAEATFKEGVIIINLPKRKDEVECGVKIKIE